MSSHQQTSMTRKKHLVSANNNYPYATSEITHKSSSSQVGVQWELLQGSERWFPKAMSSFYRLRNLCIFFFVFSIISVGVFFFLTNSVQNSHLPGARNDADCEGPGRAKECYDNIIRIAHRYQRNGTVILIVAAGGSYDVITNWCISMKILGLDNYMLVAFDDEALLFFEQRNAPVAKLPGLQAGKILVKGDVWVERTLLTFNILNAGINVLVSDVDAIMMKSPFGRPISLLDDVSYDIISTPSNFPNPKNGEVPSACPMTPPGHMEWRHQPCMGWIFFRSNTQVLDFFTELFLPDTMRYRDDQVGLSCAFRKAGALWNDGQNWTTSKAMSTVSKTPRLRIAVLPAANYLRNCTEFEKDRKEGYNLFKFEADDVEMYHCKGYNKRANAENNGFWFLLPDWNKTHMAADASFKDFLSSISVRNY